MRIFHINTTFGYNAPGRLAATLARAAAERGNCAAVAFDRVLEAVDAPGVLRIPVGTAVGRLTHALRTRLFDSHGHGSRAATRRLLSALDRFAPDVVHLHNLHGYWLNVPELIEFLAARSPRIVWTLHDFWPLTGHCSFPAQGACGRWLGGCRDCPQRRQYPASWLADRSRSNWAERRRWLRMLPEPALVAVSHWQADQVAAALGTPCGVIYNPVDSGIFNPAAAAGSAPGGVLGAASVWDARKGLDRFISLRRELPAGLRITLAGLSPGRKPALPSGISAVPRKAAQADMAAFLAGGSVFVNLSRAETLGMVNLEARCCGTPVVTLAAGGAAETVTPDSGFVLDRFDPKEVAEAVLEAASPGRFDRGAIAREAALQTAPTRACGEYFRLYEAK